MSSLLPAATDTTGTPSPAPRDTLHFPPTHQAQLAPYLPSPPNTKPSLPHVTLTFATSLDSALSLAPGTQTFLSGPQSKAMTHFLRSQHAAILIGVGTAIADDPSLNCRLEGVGGFGGEGLEGQPRPVVLDPMGRWDVNGESKVIRLAREGKGRGPWVVTAEKSVGGLVVEGREVLGRTGGRYIVVPSTEVGGREAMEWRDVFSTLHDLGIRSVMVEGGAGVINGLLEPRNAELVDSVVVTVAPTWLGEGGVVVSPPKRFDQDGKRVPTARLKDVRWIPLGEDVVMCGRLLAS
ncbi:riboflavin biosynthesis protein RibD domain-containing protein [Coniosporium apollinis CBS 100218]|uniref:2,5-diamino-6-ribosylamino-4(3H)-pyrimidinone 5'-phosphate reductase n=1 Tax=Coniosporium apollinis (strain CBS 100218) TaxID=1168221 RepID=R7Z5P9_CONA1|nr:riboflavin biosynthesis protein RibD domain-containing protein [Coniosporium apollinis CBS 100218]EON69510.1 riboflavin biosynthesis protein RibD domain-containing protein [Coniosporium apollinis CBS 100218]